MLRGLTYLQTATGQNAGNVVLWMQPDGTLNPSAEPVELPDPSDSDASYWLARTIWALGEGYAAFENADPAFARFLERRLDLAVDAVDRQVLDAYGQLPEHRRTADAGLADRRRRRRVGRGRPRARGVRRGRRQRRGARRAMTRAERGHRRAAGGDARHWPFGGVLPWALSRSDWHAWGSQMPAALARAGRRHRRQVVAPSRASATRSPSTRGCSPRAVPTTAGCRPGRRHADRLRRRLAGPVAAGTSRHRRRGRARSPGSWPRGSSGRTPPASRRTTRRPAHLRRRRSGRQRQPQLRAESTIHGLLTMIALDGDPDAAADRVTAAVAERRGHALRCRPRTAGSPEAPRR